MSRRSLAAGWLRCAGKSEARVRDLIRHDIHSNIPGIHIAQNTVLHKVSFHVMHMTLRFKSTLSASLRFTAVVRPPSTMQAYTFFS